MAAPIPSQMLEMMASRFRLMGEPTRLAIIHALIDGVERNVGQIVRDTSRSEANVSRHLKHLARAKLVTRRKEGLQVFYRLTDLVMEKVCRLVCDAIMEDFKNQNDDQVES